MTKHDAQKAAIYALVELLAQPKLPDGAASEYLELYSTLPENRRVLLEKLLVDKLQIGDEALDLLSLRYAERIYNRDKGDFRRYKQLRAEKSQRDLQARAEEAQHGVRLLEEQHRALERTHRKFLEAYKSFVTYSFPYDYRFNDNNHLFFLIPNDHKLAALWMSPRVHNKEYEMNKMLSARTAEKIAQKFYENMGYKVTDIAITQVTKPGGSERWKVCDLLVDDRVAVDVKNARRSRGSGKNASYSEHAVADCKLNRNKEDVVIFGVLSPYETFKKDTNEHIIRKDTPEHAICLGEVRQQDIKALQNHFRSDSFMPLLMEREGKGSTQFVPPWLYSYPDRFYGDYGNELAALPESYGLPEWHEVEALNIHPISFVLSQGYPLPESWKASLLPWQRQFAEVIGDLSDNRRSLPFLFLTIFKHFLDMILSAESDYRPADYKTLLYTGGVNKPISPADTPGRPLGILDPLNTVDNLCETLDRLWQHRDKLDLREYRTFQFKGRGLLHGKRPDGKKDVLLAYCGGQYERSLRPGGSCGYAPLVAGVHERCQECRKLICVKCSDHGFCEEDCPRLQALEASVYELAIDPEDIYF